MIELIVVIFFLLINKVLNKYLFKMVEGFFGYSNSPLYPRVHTYLKDSFKLLY